jgi:ABC-2 type transport system ATP-binding protein/lipopolysaccharide transport system ATP-binding protein
MRRRIDDVTDFSGLGSRIDHLVYSYSSGMQARLRFSVLTALRPDVLLIDEGIGTADAEFAHRASARLQEFVASAGVVVIASHAESLVAEYCQHGLWLHKGRVVAYDLVDRVLSSYREDSLARADVQFQPSEPVDAAV